MKRGQFMVQITEQAAKQINHLKSESSGPNGESLLRVKVVAGGCSGMSYKLDFDTSITDADKVFEEHGTKIVIDKKSILTRVLSRFTGKFDEGSTPIWKDGQLLIESVRRFKGQAASAVVLTECDMTQLDAINRRLLFVGLTRARVHLEWVISSQTATVLEKSLQI